VSYFTLAVAIIAVFYLILNLGSIASGIGWFFRVISPFIYGFVIAYVLSIPCNAMQRLLGRVKFLRRIKKPISVALLYLVMLALLYLSMMLILPRLFSSIVDLVPQLESHYQRFEAFIASLNANEQLPFNIDLNAFFLSLGVATPTDLITNFFSPEMIAAYMSAIFSTATMIFRWVLAFISSVYFLFEMEKFSRFMKRMVDALLSAKVGGVLLSYGRKINEYFKKYIFCLIMDCLFMFVAGTLILVILRSPYALILGVLLGIMNFIPYFGSIFATIVAIIVVWVTQGFTAGVISTALLLFVQQLDANVVQPRLYGTGLKLSPLLVIVSVTVGGAIGGIAGGAFAGTVVGMIVAIPIAKVLMNVLEDVIAYRERKKSAICESQQGQEQGPPEESETS